MDPASQLYDAWKKPKQRPHVEYVSGESRIDFSVPCPRCVAMWHAPDILYTYGADPRFSIGFVGSLEANDVTTWVQCGAPPGLQHWALIIVEGTWFADYFRKWLAASPPDEWDRQI